jgi:hypothetical protein
MPETDFQAGEKFKSFFFFVNPFNAGLGALYGPLILQILPVSPHRTFLNALKVTLNLQPLHLWTYLKLNPLLHSMSDTEAAQKATASGPTVKIATDSLKKFVTCNDTRQNNTEDIMFIFLTFLNICKFSVIA